MSDDLKRVFDRLDDAVDGKNHIAGSDVLLLRTRLAALERELAKARAQSLGTEMERRDLWKALASARAEAARLRDLLLDGLSHGIDDYWITTAEGVEWRERVKAALDTPAREGGEGR